MHVSFSLLRIERLYMFRALLAHPQEALQKRHLVYCVRVMSVGCGTDAVHPCTIPTAVCAASPEDEQLRLETCRGPRFSKPCHSRLILYARNILNAVCVAPPEDEQVMLEICRSPRFSVNWMKRASCWFYYTDKLRVLWRTVSKTLS
jgi:hypothetical protein